MNALIEVLLSYEKRKAVMSGAVSESGLTPIETVLNTLTPDTESP